MNRHVMSIISTCLSIGYRGRLVLADDESVDGAVEILAPNGTSCGVDVQLCGRWLSVNRDVGDDGSEGWPLREYNEGDKLRADICAAIAKAKGE